MLDLTPALLTPAGASQNDAVARIAPPLPRALIHR